MSALFLVCSGSLLIAVIALLRRVAGHRLPREFFSFLWLTATLRLLLPLRLESPFSVWNAAAALAGTPGGTPAPEALSGPVTSGVSQLLGASAQAGTLPMTFSAASPLLLIWLLGTLAFVLYFSIGYVRDLRRFRQAAPLACPEADLLLRTASIRRTVAVRLLDDRRAPLTYGFFRPVILLPVGLTDREERLSCVLAHEIAHIRRWDVAQKLLLTAVLCLHWWNPLVWRMTILASRDMELACDRIALGLLGADRRGDYARTLLTMDSLRSRPVLLYSGFGRSPAEERIQAIMKHPKRSIPILILAIVLAVGTVTAFATQPQTDATPEAGTVQQSQDWQWPVTGEEVRISAEFGSRTHPVTGAVISHDGIDLSAPAGTEIRAARTGTVLTAGFDPVKGNLLVLSHGDGLTSEYCHCADLLAAVGDELEADAVIASVGQTGQATGPHCHFAVYQDGLAADPLSILP